MLTEIRFSGFGGQGIIRCGYIVGKACALFDNKYATMAQSFGPEARGSACSSELVVSDERIFYPYMTRPHILVAMSQDAFDKFIGEVRDGALLLIDEDLVKPGNRIIKLKTFAVPATRIAEEMGNKVIANLIMLGFFTAVTELVSLEAMRQAVPGSVPERFLDLNLKGFERGYEFGGGITGKMAKPEKAMESAVSS
ncbi:MAG: 2-oxoacid:acceptor oxidoreductase family protein [Acidobacteria bacterium]|nr:2-oxoacid:acceptor oxidoreductase family protein [Acidobacteriota bacterium]